MESINVEPFGKLLFPFLLKAYNENGIAMDFVSDPGNLLQVGDKIERRDRSVWEIVECLEQRPAKGDYSMVNFSPVWQKAKVKFIYKP